MTKLLTYLFVLISTISVGQANKTFQDSVFKIGDNIKIPEIVYVLDGNGHQNDSSLKLIASFLNSHKNLICEIGSHSDSRGHLHKNMELTNNRAMSVREALIKDFGVNSNQITSRGYGNTRQIIADVEIKNAKTKQEKEELHQKNRRTELKILQIK